MRGQQYQSQGIIFLVLTLLSKIISPFIVTNIETFAQTPSTELVQACGKLLPLVSQFFGLG
jgi:hypothetical protein